MYLSIDYKVLQTNFIFANKLILTYTSIFVIFMHFPQKYCPKTLNFKISKFKGGSCLDHKLWDKREILSVQPRIIGLKRILSLGQWRDMLYLSPWIMGLKKDIVWAFESKAKIWIFYLIKLQHISLQNDLFFPNLVPFLSLNKFITKYSQNY